MTVVVKIGGARAVDPDGALADVAELVASGERVVVVHGGSTAVDETLEDLGEEPEYVETPGGVVGRFTDERTMEVFEMVLPGKLNTDLTAGLLNEGVDAVGLSGVDGGLLTGPRKSAVRVLEDGKKKIKRGDHSGKIESVDAALLEALFDAGRTPVVTVPMLGVDGAASVDDAVADDGAELVPVNADADRAAAAIAGTLGAELVVLTDVAGVYADPEDASTRIDRVVTPEGWNDLQSAAEGFMTKKVMAAEEALDGGAASVAVASANADAPVTSALDGDATTILPGALQSGDDSEAEVSAQ
ncbi:acetylglutamate/acetylaminoadipate kinase [Halorubellus sp. JP-L1]|uniref:acetylglutamate/acetylaminoadipate kinase n=1 Tax=Halorubellus sp. JP-L1 TaxID=2715753 RepID=UPI00140A3384|nr:acetylglutamate/acetylaminoadipate kinase [Halorubellus sp. JP-L1]